MNTSSRAALFPQWKPREVAMLRSELIRKVAEENKNLPLEAVEAAVLAIFEEITQALEQGQRVELRGFGSFTAKVQPGRLGRNPRTGAPVQVPTKRYPAFKSGKGIFDRINEES